MRHTIELTAEEEAARELIIGTLNKGQRDAFFAMDSFLLQSVVDEAQRGDGEYVDEYTESLTPAEGYRQLVVSGYAGTGKTYLLGKLVALYAGKIMVAAPTHKAKKVLQSKIAPPAVGGTPRLTPQVTVTTVHSLLYQSPRDEIDNLLQHINEIESSKEYTASQPAQTQFPPYFLEGHPATLSSKDGKLDKNVILRVLDSELADVQDELRVLRAKSNTLSFVPREAWPRDWPRRVIIDEASMVNKDMVDIARRLGLHVMAIGDGGQLPPVNAEKGFDLSKPDVELSEIVRQAHGSPIPVVAEAIRKASPEQLRNIVTVAKQRFPGIFSPTPIRGGMNVVRTNKTRRAINGSEAPHGNTLVVGQEYVVHKTKNDVQMVVGQRLGVLHLFTAADVPHYAKALQNKYLLLARLVRLEDNETIESLNIDMRKITLREDDPALPENMRHMREVDKITDTLVSITDIVDENTGKESDVQIERANRSGVVLALPYAITAHKAQGSEYGAVNVYHDNMFNAAYMNIDERRKWLYTAVTRAKERVYIAG